MAILENDVGIQLAQKNRLRGDTELDMTPMIDIVFLLLSFFTVCSKMDRQLPVELPKALMGQSVPDATCVMLVVKRGTAPGSYQIFKGRNIDATGLVAAQDVEGQEQEIADYVESEFARRPELQAVMIKGEELVTTGAIEVAKRGIGKSEMASTRKVYMSVQEGE